MSDHLDDLLRHRVRQAFAEIEQTVSRDVPARGRLRRLAPLGAALVLASLFAVVGGATVAVRSARLTSGTSNRASQPQGPTWTLAPDASETPAPTPAPLLPPPSPPPAGIALVWVRSAGSQTGAPNSVRLRAYDWNGALRGWIDVPNGPNAALSASPDGAYIIDGPRILDRTGRPAGTVTPPGNGGWESPTWEDDSLHFCSMFRPQGGGSQALYEQSVGGRVRLVAVMPGGVTDDSGWSIGACSHRTDRAVVIHTVCCAADEVRVYRLSTGSLLADKTVTDGAGVGPVTPDGRFAASTTSRGTTLVDTVTWATVESVHNVPAAFSWDGNVMGFGTWGSGFSVVRRTDQSMLHRFDGPVRGEIAGIRPGAADVLVAYDVGAAKDSAFPTDAGLTLVIVHGDGSTTLVTAGVLVV